MIKSMVTLFTTLKMKRNGRLCHLLPACQSTSVLFPLYLFPSSKILTCPQPFSDCIIMIR